MSDEASCEGHKKATGTAVVHFSRGLSETLKIKPYILSRNKGYTEIACVFRRPLSSKKYLVCAFQGFRALRKYFQ